MRIFPNEHPPFIDGIHFYSFVLHVFQNLLQIRYRKHWIRVLKLLLVLIASQDIDNDWNFLNYSELVSDTIMGV